MKKYFCVLMFFLSSSLICFGQGDQGNKEAKLSEKEIQDFKDQALRTITALSNQISTIADKSKETALRRSAMNLAGRLFMNPDSNIVEVSSLNGPTKRVAVRKYLNTLFFLPYSQVKIKWYNIYLSNKFERRADGRYYGTVTVSQSFEGYTSKEMGPYRDITEKQIEVIIEDSSQELGDKVEKSWRLFLGDIRVDETKQQ